MLSAAKFLDGQPRIDGRDTRTVRPLNIQTGVLPRTHGSALFTRGETQALAVATLGTSRDEQIIDRCPANIPTASCCTTTSSILYRRSGSRRRAKTS